MRYGSACDVTDDHIVLLLFQESRNLAQEPQYHQEPLILVLVLLFVMLFAKAISNL